MATIEYSRSIDRRIESCLPVEPPPRTVAIRDTPAYDMSRRQSLQNTGTIIAFLVLLPIYLIGGLFAFALIGMAFPLGMFLGMLLLIPLVLFYSLLIMASQAVFAMIGLI